MDFGGLIEIAPPSEVFAHPKNERTKLFLSKILTH
jgi:ABC-type polar amino acid transport system ATPase subunit